MLDAAPPSRRVDHGETQAVGVRVDDGLARELEPLALPPGETLIGPARRHLPGRGRQGEAEAHRPAGPPHAGGNEDAHLAGGGVPKRVGRGADGQAAVHERRA